MEKKYGLLPKIPVRVDCGTAIGTFESWRHSIGHGGINCYPLPPKVRRGLAACKPRLVRTFIQEYFDVYPAHDTYNWSLLDPYMESLAASGGQVVACICIKPAVLYPMMDQCVVMPNDIAEWQRVVAALVTRYSVEKPIVTHWEISNESDIGENGGCPFWTRTPAEYNEYYNITQAAVKQAFPQAKVGGPVVADVYSPLVEGLLAYCSEKNLPLDFVSWHRYSDDPNSHTVPVHHVKRLVERYYGAKPMELFITEFGKGFDEVCVEESAFDSFRPAVIGASILDMMDTPVDWTFYYHVWDQVFVANQFRRFYADPDIMLLHWNKIPHRMGLFGVCGEVRPTYFLYRMLAEMGNEALAAASDAKDLRVKAARDADGMSVLLVNHEPCCSRNMVAEIHCDGMTDGLYLLTVHKLDGQKNWDEDKLLLNPSERRYIDLAHMDGKPAFFCNVLCPADSVVLVRLQRANLSDMAAEYAAMK